MKKISLLLLISVFSCSHTGNNLATNRYIEREFELTIERKNKQVESIIVYASFNISNHRAKFNGISSFNVKVFSLEILGDNYILTENQNNKKIRGKLSTFKLLPLTEDLVFEKLPYTQKENIIKDKEGNIFYIIPLDSFY